VGAIVTLIGAVTAWLLIQRTVAAPSPAAVQAAGQADAIGSEALAADSGAA
jgi:hypothetical protein